MTTTEAKQISLISILKHLGFEAVTESPYRYVYRSPFNSDEKTPSFFVHPERNVFTCFSTGKKGDVIKFIEEFKNLSFHQAMNFLSDLNLANQFPKSESFSFNGTTKHPTANQVLKVSKLVSNRLIDYLISRKINIDIANVYCKEVFYKTTDGSRYFSIGFPNDNGGFALRNRLLKNNIGKQGISTIQGSNSSCVLLFEGFMDFLSLLTIQKATKPEFDAIILNSVGALRNAIPMLSNYEKVISYLDNDTSGIRATDSIMFKFKVINKSVNFLPHKDLNEYLMNCNGSVGYLKPNSSVLQG